MPDTNEMIEEKESGINNNKGVMLSDINVPAVSEAQVTKGFELLFIAKTEDFITVSAEYYTFLPSTEYRIMVIGLKEIDFNSDVDKLAGKTELTPCVEFKMFDPETIAVDKRTKQTTGTVKNYISGAAVLVGVVQNEYAKTPNAPIIGLLVQTEKEIKANKGSYMGMKVGRLFQPDSNASN